MIYPLPPNPIFWTIQGEGHLRGFQMAFLRLAGCSVGCAECDTDYRVNERVELEQIVERVQAVRPTGDRDGWVCVTGGEPTNHDLVPLLKALKSAGLSTMLITSGINRVVPPVDWLSVSPHSNSFVQRYGNEVKLVDGLNGLNVNEWYEANPDDTTDFFYRYVQPLWIGTPEDGREDPESMERCLWFLKDHPNWSLSRQDHKLWGVA